MQKRISAKLEASFIEHRSIQKCKFDIKSTVLSNLHADEYASSQLIHTLATEMSAKMQFFRDFKESKTSHADNAALEPLELEETEMQDAKKKFIAECNSQLTCVLPTLLRIKDQHLILNGYQLSQGICKGIHMAFNEFTMMLRKITLVSNGLTDETFATILKGLNNQDNIEYIYYKQNGLGLQSLEQLIPIVEKRNQLKELHIIDCRVTPRACSGLLAAIKDHDSIRRLSLRKASVTPACVPDLATYLSNSMKLRYLDLSYNGLGCKAVAELCAVLGDSNRSLQYLNLAWNTITSKVADNMQYGSPELAAEYKHQLTEL